ncbi:MAG: hypothetical protein U5K54_29080 [Cytophagales bacterium]|nr:hypothetical protein [Cytophagales bacterium]
MPTEAVIPEQEGKKVFILVNGKAKEAKVETGIRTANSLGDSIRAKSQRHLTNHGYFAAKGWYECSDFKVRLRAENYLKEYGKFIDNKY